MDAHHAESTDEELEVRFLRDVLRNRHNRAILAQWEALALPDGWLVAGCLFQTVWNLQAGMPPEARIKDYDLFYFDASDLSEASEAAVQSRADTLLKGEGVTVEVTNQARVHLWYEAHFGHAYPPLHSAREGIDRFLIPATCVGIRPGKIYAPNCLRLLYDGILTPNPLTPHQALFEHKAASYCARWPGLSIIRDQHAIASAAE